MRTSSEVTSDVLANSLNRWLCAETTNSLRSDAEPHKPCWTIAISREAGSGGGEVACEVGAQLGWEVFDRELIEKIASTKGTRAELLQNVDEKHVSWITECLEAFAGVPAVTASSYARDLVETLLVLSAKGNCVIVGRGATVLLSHKSTLRVRVVASIEDRIARTSKALGLGKHEAEQYVKATDNQRAQFVHRHYHKDSNDMSHYDLIVNTSRLSVKQCATMIVHALHLVQTHIQK